MNLAEQLKKSLPESVRSCLRRDVFKKSIFTIRYSTCAFWLFLKNSFFTFLDPGKNLINQKKVTVKFITNSITSDAAAKVFSKYLLQDMPFEIVSSRFADYYVIINHPYHTLEYFDPKHTIVFWYEPWEIRRLWLSFAKPSPQQFLHVVSDTNVHMWYVSSTAVELLKSASFEKTKGDIISSLTSNLYTLSGHQKRLNFLAYLDKSQTVPTEVFGFIRHYGTKTGENILKQLSGYKGEAAEKDEGLLPYKYHFAAENVSEQGFYTEKILDPILAECLTFYWGCPNLEDYIDERAYIRLDLDNFAESLQIIKEAIANNEWEKRLPFIQAAKRKIITDLQIMAVVSNIISANQSSILELSDK